MVHGYAVRSKSLRVRHDPEGGGEYKSGREDAHQCSLTYSQPRTITNCNNSQNLPPEELLSQHACHERKLSLRRRHGLLRRGPDNAGRSPSQLLAEPLRLIIDVRDRAHATAICAAKCLEPSFRPTSSFPERRSKWAGPSRLRSTTMPKLPAANPTICTLAQTAP